MGGSAGEVQKRLWPFHPDAGKLFGPEIVSISPLIGKNLIDVAWVPEKEHSSVPYSVVSSPSVSKLPRPIYQCQSNSVD